MLAFVRIHLNIVTDISTGETSTEDEDFGDYFRLNSLLEQPSETFERPIFIESYVGYKQYRKVGIFWTLCLLCPPFLTGVSSVGEK
jgi:hypothetical protein